MARTKFESVLAGYLTATLGRPVSPDDIEFWALLESDARAHNGDGCEVVESKRFGVWVSVKQKRSKGD